MRDLSGKVAVVTGAASGIGLAVTERLVHAGMSVVMADIEEGPLGAAAERLLASGATVVPVPTDVSDAEAVERLAARADAELGPVYLVHNNAGVESMGSVTWETPPQAWEWTLGVNLRGVLHGIRSFVPDMVARNEGYVVNTASLAGLIAMPGLASYAATKAAVVTVTETLCNELRAIGSNVGVSVLVPSIVDTKLMDARRNWPERLGPRPEITGMLADHVRGSAADQLRTEGMAPSEVADLLVDAVTHDRFWVFTHPESTAMFTDRFVRAARGDDPAIPSP